MWTKLRPYLFFFYVLTACFDLNNSNFSIAVPLNIELIITGYHFDHQSVNAIGTNWHIPPHIYKGIPTNASCGVLYTGTMKLPKSHAKAWLHGSGMLLASIPQGGQEEIACTYMTNIGIFPRNPHDIPYTLNAAVLCLVSAKEHPRVEHTCDLVETIEYKSGNTRLTLNSPCSLGSRSCGDEQVQATFSLPSDITSRIRSTTGAPDKPPQQYDTTVRKAVCTVQTFMNDATGPMLHLFARYYLETGWIVVIYDRFGQHQYALKRLMSLYQDRLLYHPYTLLQLVFPALYNLNYYWNQNISFMHYNKQSANEGKSAIIIGDNEEGNQNSDKRKTYIHARQRYRHIPLMLFVDRDELLFCPSIADDIWQYRTEQNGIIPPRREAIASVALQAVYQDKLLLNLEKNGFQRIGFKRVLYSPRPEQYTSTVISQSGDISQEFHRYTTDCITREFRNIEQGVGEADGLKRLLGCWQGTAVERKPYSRKCAEIGMGGVCPFFGVHTACLRCQCKEIRPASNGCHIMHLSRAVIPQRIGVDEIAENVTHYSDSLETFLLNM